MYEISNGVVRMERPGGRRRMGLRGFLLLAFGLSWLGALPMVAASWLGGGSSWRPLIVALAPLQLLMFFGALIAAVAATSVNHGRAGLRELARAVFRWRVGARWYVLALAVPGVLTVAAAFAGAAIDPSLPTFSLRGSALLSVAQILGVYLVLNTEEVAWRGYALPVLQSRRRPLQANLLLAAIWGAFHLPYFLMKGGHPGGHDPATFAVMIVAITLVMGATFNATRGSVLICHLLHQSLNAWSEGLRMFPTMNGGSPWPVRMFVFGLVGLGAIAAYRLWTLGRDCRDGSGGVPVTIPD